MIQSLTTALTNISMKLMLKSILFDVNVWKNSIDTYYLFFQIDFFGSVRFCLSASVQILLEYMQGIINLLEISKIMDFLL